jgi:hypothetical protein
MKLPDFMIEPNLNSKYQKWLKFVTKNPFNYIVFHLLPIWILCFIVGWLAK